MKSKVWSYVAIVLGVLCFCLGLAVFFVAAIGGRNSMANVRTVNYIMTIAGIVIGAVCVLCAGKRTEWRVNMVQGFSILGKIGIMLNIVVLAATLMAK